MISNTLFHPDHIVPPAKFVTAFVKFTYQPVSQMLMVLDTVSGEILVLNNGAANTCIQVGDVLQYQSLFNKK